MAIPAYVPLRSTDTPTSADVAALDRLCGAISDQTRGGRCAAVPTDGTVWTLAPHATTWAPA